MRAGVHDPCFQFSTGEELFQHAFPHGRSDLGHWRKRLGDKLERLLAESLRVAHEVGALRSQDLKRVMVDTTVQPKAISFPTDAKLLHAAIFGVNRLARKHGVRLRQSYARVAKSAAMMAGRYTHAKQMGRMPAFSDGIAMCQVCGETARQGKAGSMKEATVVGVDRKRRSAPTFSRRMR